MPQDKTAARIGEFELYWRQTGPSEWEAEIIDRQSGHRSTLRDADQLWAFLARCLGADPGSIDLPSD